MFEEMYRTIGMFSIATPAKIEKPLKKPFAYLKNELAGGSM